MSDLPEGVYDLLVTSALRDALRQLPATLKAQTEALSTQDALEYLARELADKARAHLRDAAQEGDTERLLALANVLLVAAGSPDNAESELLTSIGPTIAKPPKPPVIPMSQSALVTNDQGLNYHTLLRSELLSADRVDLICPFIGNQGLNLILDPLRELGQNLRVITTTYLGGTNLRALERLAETGAEIKIVFERPDQKTALHAKAWIFHRKSGFTTAALGSSNISPKALVDGLEWNIRVGARDAPQVIAELIVTFERLWADKLYEPFNPKADTERVRLELAAQRGGALDEPTFFADLVPRPHQQEALDALKYARLNGRHRNLIVAATGTGKTLLAAFDYQRIAREQRSRPTLLFVAHRQDILKQSLSAFQNVLRDSNFGELNVGDKRADGWNQVFASVQSLSAKNLNEFNPDRFDVIVVDEFHHTEAPTYRRLLDHFRPHEFLGLTATPERSDGKRDVLGELTPATYELRLWHALERRLLCPFHYFGIEDGTDLSTISWSGGRYDDRELNDVFVNRGEERAKVVIRELREKCREDDLRAVAFCATIQHANFMADRFRQAGYRAEALHSENSPAERAGRVKDFRAGRLPIICTVDLFNEGIDIPEINTVLFLRPTESATVFIQQLGRGLRNHYDKGALTVLDFVGHQHKNFRMDLRFRAMTGLSRSELKAAMADGFPQLPPGCDIRLDRMSMERVLENLQQAIPSSLRDLANEARRLALPGKPPSLGEFLRETGLEIGDIYRSRHSYSQILKAADLLEESVPESHHRIGAIIHADDKRRLLAYRNVVMEAAADLRAVNETSNHAGAPQRHDGGPQANGYPAERGNLSESPSGKEGVLRPAQSLPSGTPQADGSPAERGNLSDSGSGKEGVFRPERSLPLTPHSTHDQPPTPINPQNPNEPADPYRRMVSFAVGESMQPTDTPPLMRSELTEVFDFLIDTALPLPLLADDLPFSLHARYTRDEIVAPFRDNPKSMRQGTFYVAEFGLDVHLVTLRKSDRKFSPTTRYQDYFESPEVLHWESQSTTTLASPTGQRLVSGTGRHLFFVRVDTEADGRPEPFFCAGFASPISSESEKPIILRWGLEHPIPDHTYIRFEHAAG